VKHPDKFLFIYVIYMVFTHPGDGDRQSKKHVRGSDLDCTRHLFLVFKRNLIDYGCAFVRKQNDVDRNIGA
jgi:hypothetical protein